VNHAQAVRGQSSSAAQARPTQANIQSHASRAQTLPQAAIPEAVPTVVQSTHLAGASDSIPELPVDENWHPTGQMRGSLRGNAYKIAIQRYLGSVADQRSQPRSHRASDGKRHH
jgi:E3 SUMO-protein ligase PIAS1